MPRIPVVTIIRLRLLYKKCSSVLPILVGNSPNWLKHSGGWSLQFLEHYRNMLQITRNMSALLGSWFQCVCLGVPNVS